MKTITYYEVSTWAMLIVDYLLIVGGPKQNVVSLLVTLAKCISTIM